MTVLALELSSSRRSVAVLPDGANEPFVAVEPLPADPRATHAFELIDRALTLAGKKREEIDVVAVGLGPGSYTGIRVAISIAQGWAAAGRVRLIGVPTVELLAEQILREGKLENATLAFDAQRGDLYATRYQWSPSGSSVIAPLQIVSLLEVNQRRNEGELFLGPDLELILADARSLWPDAGILSKMARDRQSAAVAPEDLAPIYLRETQFVKLPGR